MLAHSTLFLVLFHFFHFTLAVPNPANGVFPRDPTAPAKGADLAMIAREIVPRDKTNIHDSSVDCTPVGSYPLFNDILDASTIGLGNGDNSADHSDPGCTAAFSSGSAVFDVCGQYEGTWFEVADAALKITFECDGDPDYENDENIRSGGTMTGSNGSWQIRVRGP